MKAQVRLTRSIYAAGSRADRFALLARQGQTAEADLGELSGRATHPSRSARPDRGLLIRPDGSEAWFVVPFHVVEFVSCAMEGDSL